jgi:hypothetical protein
MSVGLEKTVKRFEEEALRFAEQGGAELRFVFAPYGRGKTHLLWALREVAMRKGFVTAYVDCNSGHSPFESSQKTYHMIANSMLPPQADGDGVWKTGVDAVIERSILSVRNDDAKKKILGLRGDQRLAADFRNLAAAYGSLIFIGEQRSPLGTDLKALLRADLSYRVKVSDLYRSHKWLPRPIGKLVRRNAAGWMRSLATLPASLGFPGLSVFFDETEQTLSLQKMSKKNRQIHLSNLRNLVDHLALGSFHGCIIYYAVVEELLEVARSELDALRQRLERVHLAEAGVLRNPRAVWVDLDELTDPGPGEKRFFEELGNRILDIGMDAGLPESSRAEFLNKVSRLSKRYSRSISDGAVREFVKEAANHIAQGVNRHG